MKRRKEWFEREKTIDAWLREEWPQGTLSFPRSNTRKQVRAIVSDHLLAFLVFFDRVKESADSGHNVLWKDSLA